MKKITFCLLALLITCTMWQVNAQTVSSGNIDTAIPDGNPTGVTVNLVVTDNLTITDLNFSTEIIHSWASDLAITLESPAGTIITVYDPASCSQNSIRVTLDDAAAALPPCDASTTTPTTLPYVGPYSYTADGTFKPFSALSAFNGENTMGTWKMKVVDGVGGDPGFIRDWSLTYVGFVPPPPPAGLVTFCATDNPQAIDDFNTATSLVNVTDSGTIGAMTSEYVFDEVFTELQHQRAGDLIFTLTSPEGTVFDLCSNNGGSTGLDAVEDFILRDDSTNGNVIAWAGAPTAADYIAEGGALNAAFDGEEINGVWTLTISDGGFGDEGDLFDFCLAFIANGVVGNPPIITCPADVMANNDLDECSAVVNYSLPSVFDFEDTPNPTPVLVSGPVTGSMFPVGTTNVVFEATDSDGNTVQCDFDVIISDSQAPDAMCVGSITVELDPVTGMVSITPDMIDDGSTDNCGIDTYALDIDTFDCTMLGDNTVELTVTDDAGNASTCTATVVVEDNTAPEIVCIGEQLVPPVTDSTSPGSAIVSTTVSTLTVGNDVAIDDLNVNLDISHAWIGDIIVTLESPMGTVVTLIDQIGAPLTLFGCPDDGVLVTLDDAAANPIEDSCSGGVITGDFSPNGSLADFNGEDTAGDWTLTIVDTFTGGDDGVLNSWGITYEFAPMVTPPYEAVLEPDGTVTIDPNDLIDSVNEICNYTVTAGGATGSTPSSCDLSSSTPDDATSSNVWDRPFAGGTCCSGLGPVSYDVYGPFTVDASGSYTIDSTQSFDGYIFVYETAFDPLDQTTNFVAGDDDGPGGIGTSQIMTTLNTGTEYYIVTTGFSAGDFGTYTSAITGPGTVTCGASGGPGGFVLTCENLGMNTIEVTVTDEAGNTATCMATVNVTDVTAPEVICSGSPGPNSGSASASPGAAIPDNNPAGLSSTISITQDWAIDDLNIDIDVTHTWVGDLEITLESPAGTVVTLFESGCSANDMMFTFDDEGTGNLATCTAGSDSDAYPEDSYVPDNPLSAFDGENTMGDWILNISDNAGLDTGTLNAWGLTYTYMDPGTPLTVSLDENGMATITAQDVLLNYDDADACGINTALLDITDFDCDDAGTSVMVVVLVSDASGNTSTCTAEVNIVDDMAPVLTCPGDQTVDSSDDTGVYVVPDYFDTGDATATDNCTDPVVNTQDPAPGTTMGVGPTHPVTLTSTDEAGNVSTCTFNVEVEFLGVQDNALENAISMYPNPASSQVTIANKSNIALQQVMIYDVNGKLVNQINLSNMQGEKVIDVSALSSGIYMVRIIGDQASVVKRLIKK